MIKDLLSKKRLSKIAGITILAAFTGFTSFGQIRMEQLYKASPRYIDWGVQIGGNVSLIKAYPFESKPSPGLLIGAFAKKHTRDWGVQVGLQAATSKFTTTKSAAYKYSGSTYYATPTDTSLKGELTNIHLQVPVIVELRPGRHWGLQVGAVYSFLVTSMDKDDLLAKNYKTTELFKKSNMGAFFGVEVELSRKLRFGASFIANLQDVNNGKFQQQTDSWRTVFGQAMLSYQIKRWHGHRL